MSFTAFSTNPIRIIFDQDEIKTFYSFGSIQMHVPIHLILRTLWNIYQRWSTMLHLSIHLMNGTAFFNASLTNKSSLLHPLWQSRISWRVGRGHGHGLKSRLSKRILNVTYYKQCNISMRMKIIINIGHDLGKGLDRFKTNSPRKSENYCWDEIFHSWSTRTTSSWTRSCKRLIRSTQKKTRVIYSALTTPCWLD